MTLTRNRESVVINPREYDTKGLPERYFHKGELEVLLHLFESVNPKVIIEFGVNTGRNAVAALRNIPSIERYIGIDVEQDYETIMPVQRKEIPAIPGELALDNPKFELVVKPNGSFDLTYDDLPECDAVFIDADHSRKGVLNDLAIAEKIVKIGGIIIFHDDNCLKAVEVTETLNDLCNSGYDIKHVANTWIAFKRC
jgi:predicted O-methyltransferase YrrM